MPSRTRRRAAEPSRTRTGSSGETPCDRLRRARRATATARFPPPRHLRLEHAAGDELAARDQIRGKPDLERPGRLARRCWRGSIAGPPGCLPKRAGSGPIAGASVLEAAAGCPAAVPFTRKALTSGPRNEASWRYKTAIGAIFGRRRIRRSATPESRSPAAFARSALAGRLPASEQRAGRESTASVPPPFVGLAVEMPDRLRYRVRRRGDCRRGCPGETSRARFHSRPPPERVRSTAVRSHEWLPSRGPIKIETRSPG